MAQNFKRLGAVEMTANTQANIYVVPAATEAVMSTIVICNQNQINTSYSLIVMDASEFSTSPGRAPFVARGAVVPAADSIILSLGLTANAGTVIAANTNNENVSISIFGSEIT